MAGIRKTGQINSLKNLNETLHLGLTSKEINDMSQNQLMKKIFEIKKKYKLTIPKHSILKRKENHEWLGGLSY